MIAQYKLLPQYSMRRGHTCVGRNWEESCTPNEQCKRRQDTDTREEEDFSVRNSILTNK